MAILKQRDDGDSTIFLTITSTSTMSNNIPQPTDSSENTVQIVSWVQQTSVRTLVTSLPLLHEYQQFHLLHNQKQQQFMFHIITAMNQQIVHYHQVLLNHPPMNLHQPQLEELDQCQIFQVIPHLVTSLQRHHPTDLLKLD